MIPRLSKYRFKFKYVDEVYYSKNTSSSPFDHLKSRVLL